MRVLELFKGTGSISKYFSQYDFIEVISLDIEKKYNPTICEDIMNWDYTIYPRDYFDLITMSPVCLYWSNLRNSWIGRKCKSIHPTEIITKELIWEDIKNKGFPMVYKCFEIVDYFSGNPNLKWTLENPKGSKMWKHIEEEYSHRFPYYKYIFSYCKYHTEEEPFEYEKPTTFITNYEGVEPKRCKKDCENIITIYTNKGDKHPSGREIKSQTRTLHKKQIGLDKNKNHTVIQKRRKQQLGNLKYQKEKDNQLKEIIQKVHKTRMGTSKTVIDNGKIVRVNSKELREKYRHAKNISDVGGGTNRDMRYRIPQGLIHDLMKPLM